MTDPCTPLTPAVTFNYAEWTAMFPQFSAVAPAAAAGFFLRAGLYFANNQANPAYCSGNMTILLYLLTAHIAALSAPRDAVGNPSATGSSTPAPAGRISSASEGSVSVSYELPDSGSPSEAWYTQTAYGFEFWTATAQYRTMHYAAQRTFVPTAIYPMRRRGW